MSPRSDSPPSPAGDERPLDVTESVSPPPGLVDELAAEYIERLTAGEEPDLSEWLERVDDPDQRAELRTLIEAATDAERMLPSPASERTLLRGRYRIQEEIGAGGMGRVFKAFDLELRRTVAVKMLAAFDEQDDGRRAMFLRESRLLASMQHPNIVAVHEAGSEDGRTFIVMDLVDGRSLSDVISHARKELEVRSTDTKLVPHEAELWERAVDRPILEGRANLYDAGSWSETAGRIALELARTIEAAHGCGVLHRDLKPQNVMLLGGANPVVLDFGLGGSVDVSEGAVTQGLYGSVAYLAPEQVESYRVGNDPRTDVYQLGLILYEMLTLRRAFPGESMGQVLDHIKHGQYKPLRAWSASIPRGLAAICRMALELDPAHRYQTAAELRADLERYFEGREDPVALRASRVRTLWRRARWSMRRHPVLSAISGMVLVGLAVFLGSFLVLERDLVVDIGGLRVESDTFQRLGPDDALQAADMLALEVVSDRPIYLYALSVAEERGTQDRYVTPIAIELVEDGGARAGEWGLQLPREKCMVLCSNRVDDTSSRLGLIAWASTTRQPELDEFLSSVGALGDEVYIGAGVPIQEARELLADVLDSSRAGRPVRSQAEEEEFRKAREMLRNKTSAGKAEAWTLPGAEARKLEWRIE